jgi:hypothetical protein
MLQFQLVTNVVESNDADASLGAGQRKFGRIYQRFWSARCCDPRHLQSEQLIRVSHDASDWNSLP